MPRMSNRFSDSLETQLQLVRHTAGTLRALLEEDLTLEDRDRIVRKLDDLDIALMILEDAVASDDAPVVPVARPASRARLRSRR